MKIVALGFLLACTVWAPLFGQSNNDSYQNGTIVSVDSVPVQSGGGTDVQLTANAADHDVSIQVGNTVYLCRYHSVSDQDLSWLRNKAVHVKIQGKVMYVKRVTGKDAKARIVSSSKAASG